MPLSFSNYWDFRPELYTEENMPRTTRTTNRHEATVMCKLIDRKGFTKFQRMTLRDAMDRIHIPFPSYTIDRVSQTLVFDFQGENRSGVRIYQEHYIYTENTDTEMDNAVGEMVRGDTPSSPDGSPLATSNPGFAYQQRYEPVYVRGMDGSSVVAGVSPMGTIGGGGGGAGNNLAYRYGTFNSTGVVNDQNGSSNVGNNTAGQPIGQLYGMNVLRGPEPQPEEAVTTTTNSADLSRDYPF
jgi:hypothetical protein